MSLSVPSILLLCLAAVFFYWFYLRRLCVDTTPRNFHVYEALRSPSVREATSALERRIAMAVREAARGSRPCTVCDFANTTQMKDASCALCGAPLPRPPRHGLARLMPASPTGADQESTKGHSSRQRRVRRRKEWAREVDERGNVAWRRDAQTRDPLLMDFPCYVLQSSRTHDPDEEDKLEEEITIQVDKPDTKEAKPEHTGSALKSIASAMQSKIDSTAISIADVTVSDPAHVAFTSSTTTSAVPKATLDYPAKLVDFMTSVASLLTEKTNESSMPLVARFSIVREELWNHSVEAIATMTAEQARYPIRVEFVGEPGIDAGALYREWIGVLNKTLITPEAGIFICVDSHEQTFYLNPHSRELLGESHLAHFLVAGRLIGRALLDGNVTGFQLAPPLLKIILGLPVGFDDLECFDAEAFKNLQWLLTNDGVDALGLDFTVVEKLPDGKMKVVELVPGGSEIDVTDANKLEYIDRKLKYLLFESVQSQLFAFLTGLYEVAPADLLTAFDAEELALLLSGSDEIDVDDWEANTIAYIETETSERKRLALLPCYENFWKVVRAMSNDERRRLLHFATGSTRPPPGGFSSLTSYDGRLALFTMRGVTAETTRGYLQSHACFNRLDIPTFWGITNLRKAIYAAIATEEDGFTIA